MLYRIKSKEWFINRSNTPLETRTFKVTDYNGRARVFTGSMFSHCGTIIDTPRFDKRSTGNTLIIGGHRFYEGWYEEYTPTMFGRIRQKNGFVLCEIKK